MRARSLLMLSAAALAALCLNSADIIERFPNAFVKSQRARAG